MIVPRATKPSTINTVASRATDTSTMVAADARSGRDTPTQTEDDAPIQVGIELELVPSHNP